jgi:hypothetical protein
MLNMPVILLGDHGFMGRNDVRSVLMACEESMPDGAEALLIRDRLSEIRICG